METKEALSLKSRFRPRIPRHLATEADEEEKAVENNLPEVAKEAVIDVEELTEKTPETDEKKVPETVAEVPETKDGE